MILCREHCGTGIGHFLLVLGVIGVCKMLMYSLMTYLGLICIMALYDTHWSFCPDPTVVAEFLLGTSGSGYCHDQGQISDLQLNCWPSQNLAMPSTFGCNLVRGQNWATSPKRILLAKLPHDLSCQFAGPSSFGWPNCMQGDEANGKAYLLLENVTQNITRVHLSNQSSIYAPFKLSYSLQLNIRKRSIWTTSYKNILVSCV